MSDTSSPNSPPNSGTSSLLITLGVIVLVVIGVVLLGRAGDPPLERTATGVKSSVAWLQANKIKVRLFKGETPLFEPRTSLRILPLYDTDLTKGSERPETREEVIEQTTEFDLARSVFRRKIRSLQTLVVLPKWRSGVRALGVAHEDLLIPQEELNRLLLQIGVRQNEALPDTDEVDEDLLEGIGQVAAKVLRDDAGWSSPTVEISDQEHRIGLLHAQTVAAANCTPIIGTKQNMLFGECQPTQKTSFFLLADPDLMNNHGLANADNGAAFLAVIQSFDPQEQVVVDLSTRHFVRDKVPYQGTHERSWEDIERMFRWPFTMIWIAFGFLGALVFWRAITRYGPPARGEPDEPMAAKTVSIDAKARLLRLANHDGALLESHIRARLQHLAAELLGPGRRPGNAQQQVMALLRRSKPELAQELDGATRDDGTLDPIRRLDRFENCYDRIKDEFGKPANSRH